MKRRVRVGDAPGSALRSTKQQPGCPPGCTARCWTTVMIAASLILVVLAIVVVAISVFVAANSNSIQRYCVTGVPMAGSAENTTAFLNGVIETNAESDTITYTLFYDNLSPITSLGVYGPMDPITQVGPVFFYLCGGTPSNLACFPSGGGYLNSTRITVYVPVDSVEDPYSYILNVRATPWLYYMQANTVDSPAGAMRAPLTSICGTP